MRRSLTLAFVGQFVVVAALSGCVEAAPDTSPSPSPSDLHAKAEEMLGTVKAGQPAVPTDQLCAALLTLDVEALMGTPSGEATAASGAQSCRVNGAGGAASVEAFYAKGEDAELIFSAVGKPGTTIGLGENSAYKPMTIEQLNMHAAVVGVLSGDEAVTLMVATHPVDRPETPSEDEMATALKQLLLELEVEY